MAASGATRVGTESGAANRVVDAIEHDVRLRVVQDQIGVEKPVEDVFRKPRQYSKHGRWHARDWVLLRILRVHLPSPLTRIVVLQELAGRGSRDRPKHLPKRPAGVIREDVVTPRTRPRLANAFGE